MIKLKYGIVSLRICQAIAARIYRAILELESDENNDGFTVHQIAQRTGESEALIRKLLTCLSGLGVIEELPAGDYYKVKKFAYLSLIASPGYIVNPRDPECLSIFFN